MCIRDSHYNDHTVFGRFRIASVFGVIIFVSAMYFFQGYPKLYFLFVGDERPFAQLPLGTTIILAVFMLLILTYLINIIRHQYYNHFASNVAGNAIFPNGLHHFALTIAFTLSLVILCCVFLKIFEKGNIWMFLLTYQIIITVISPLYILFATPRLQIYTKKVILNSKTLMMDVLNNLKSERGSWSLTKRSQRIEPII